MNRLLLYLLMLPKPLWERFGANTDQLAALLDVRLKLDDRKPVTLGRSGSRAKKSRRLASSIAALVSFATGLMYVFPLVIIEDRFSGLWMYCTMFLFLLTITLITDFSTVLIDTRDKYVVLPRPISGRTLFLARLLHIFIYLIRIVLPMSLPGWITIGLLCGWKAAILFPAVLLLLTLTALFAVMGIYLLMLRATSAARFKEALSSFQILFSVVVFALYYLVPRGADNEAFRAFNIHQYRAAVLTPPYWLAAIFSPALPAAGRPLAMLWIPAVVIPMLCLAATLKWLAPAFIARLAALDDGAQAPGKSGVAARQGRRKLISVERLAQWLNTRKDAQAGFMLAWLQTGRSRSFRLRVYPMFAYVPIYFVFLMLQSDRPFSESWARLPHTGRHIALLYMSSMVMLQAFAFMGPSENYKAAWVYNALPISRPGAILAGAAKVVWIKYFAPFFVVTGAFVVWIWGIAAMVDVALAMLNITLFAACILRTAYQRFPFSHPDGITSAKGSRFLRAFVGLAVPGALGLAHYLALDMLWLKALFFALSAGLLWLVWDSYAQTGWDALTSTEH